MQAVYLSMKFASEEMLSFINGSILLMQICFATIKVVPNRDFEIKGNRSKTYIGLLQNFH
jgi:hypothetical protein